LRVPEHDARETTKLLSAQGRRRRLAGYQRHVSDEVSQQARR